MSLFAAGWLGCTVAAARRAGSAPSWLLAGAVVVTMTLALTLVELIGVDAASLTSIGPALLQLWFLAAGVALLRRPVR